MQEEFDERGLGDSTLIVEVILDESGLLDKGWQTVEARAVREGDWVRWPAESDTMRRITERGPSSMDDRGRTYVFAFSEYDDYEYEWLNTQPVEVWRG